MKILYGSDTCCYKDITQYLFHKIYIFTNIYIPQNETFRAELFSDPCPNHLKNIVIIDNDQNSTIYNSGEKIMINTAKKSIKQMINSDVNYINASSAEDKLQIIHNYVDLKYGNMAGEYPEQIMAMTFISPDSKVLEIGSNIGINSIVISTILNDDKNLVTLECDKKHIQKLNFHKYSNGYEFNIEPRALSSLPLAQRGWHTFPIENGVVPTDSIKIDTITYDEITKKYNINFDTLVADCEGALYFILKDMPYILNDIKLLIVENDYIDIQHKKFVDNILLQYGFNRIYFKEGGWENGDCYDVFYEVWKK